MVADNKNLYLGEVSFFFVETLISTISCLQIDLSLPYPNMDNGDRSVWSSTMTVPIGCNVIENVTRPAIINLISANYTELYF